MEWLAIIGPVTGLLGILGVVFNYSVIRPLNIAINNLNIAVNCKLNLNNHNQKTHSLA